MAEQPLRAWIQLASSGTCSKPYERFAVPTISDSLPTAASSDLWSLDLVLLENLMLDRGSACPSCLGDCATGMQQRSIAKLIVLYWSHPAVLDSLSALHLQPVYVNRFVFLRLLQPWFAIRFRSWHACMQTLSFHKQCQKLEPGTYWRCLKACRHPARQRLSGLHIRAASNMAPEKREYDQRWNKIWENGLNAGEVRNPRVCATHIQKTKALYSRAVVPERFHP